MKRVLSFVAIGFLAVACSKSSSSDTSKTTAAADAPCDQVVTKLASFNPGSGAPEKKLWEKVCPSMPPAMRACIVASKTKADVDACGNKK